MIKENYYKDYYNYMIPKVENYGSSSGDNCSISDDGTKKSLKGLIAVFEENGEHTVQVQCSKEDENLGILQTIYEDGKFYNETTLTIIRGKLEDLVSKEQPELVKN